MEIRRLMLPVERYHEITAMEGPLKGADPAKLQRMHIAAVEVDGRVVGYWIGWYGYHVEPLQVDVQWRSHPAVIKGIVEQMQEMVLATGEPSAFCTIEQENLEVVGGYAHRLGFLEAPGKLFYVVVDQVVTPQEPVAP